MIRKGIRPGIRPALDLPGDAQTFRSVLPFRRSWVAIAVVAAFDIAFMIPAVLSFGQAERVCKTCGWNRPYPSPKKGVRALFCKADLRRD